ncbi:hypothetical protein DM02DRAFT_623719 [Periconia macrospinosa]|uniref:BZIP domain-containing protein n=1 Tax=Periconia macrospinosa TaxID=97972 RepID=A0A2V1E628_9PLEO|nr:hypothetical protein DM02DRAFT_623719 [Periconia macrospinosa]
MKSFTFRQYKRSPKEVKRRKNLQSRSFNCFTYANCRPDQQQKLTRAKTDSNSPDNGNNDPKDKESAAYQKRREQVRRAQRTHRERKETYTRQLESEILELRNRESYLLLKSRSYEEELTRLRQILERNGISHEKEFDWFTAPEAPGIDRMMTGSAIKLAQNPLGQHQLHIDVGNDSSGSLWLTESEGASSADVTKRSFLGRKKSVHKIEKNPVFESVEGNSLSAEANLKIGDLGQIELGIEFVLTLESPCLHHIQGEIANGADHATCHTFTATASLLQHSPKRLAEMSDQNQHEWTAPYAALENLLKLSEQLDFEGGLAPIQVWARLRQYLGFESLDIVRLRWLTREMLKKMECHGFGAVIDEESFARLVDAVLPQSGFAF